MFRLPVFTILPNFLPLAGETPALQGTLLFSWSLGLDFLAAIWKDGRVHFPTSFLFNTVKHP